MPTIPRPLSFALGALTGFLLTACKDFAHLPDAEVTLVQPVTAKRGPDRGPYTLTSIMPEAYDVYMAESPGPKRGELVGRLEAGSPDSPAVLVVYDVAPDTRYYFDLVGEDNAVRVSERRLPLEGADNFRDLGGLPAADGRRVRWGQFFRADKLSDLTERDLAYLRSLDLHSVVDLRSEEEIAGAPDVLPLRGDGTEVDYVHLPIYNEAEDTTNIRERILDGTFARDEADNLLVEVNRLLGGSEAHRFRPFMDLITGGDGVPVVYHCTSGKDRTGFATYLILHTLGVDSALVFDDYLMSNYYRFDRNKWNLRKVNLASYFKPVDPEVMKPLMLVDPKYLQAAVDVIESEYGTIDSFLVAQYGITDAVREQLRDRYLYEPSIGEPGVKGPPAPPAELVRD